MEKELEKLRKNVEEALSSKEIMVTDVCYHKENNYNFLTIELDKVNGIDLDEIVEATNIINPINITNIRIANQTSIFFI